MSLDVLTHLHLCSILVLALTACGGAGARRGAAPGFGGGGGGGVAGAGGDAAGGDVADVAGSPGEGEGEGEGAGPGAAQGGGGEGEGEGEGEAGEGEGEAGGAGDTGDNGGGGEAGGVDPNCQPVREVCDGVDNDCDAEVDEDDPRLGDGCDTGLVGPCWQGRRRCVDSEMACVAVVDPHEEVCDGVDNDCDGEADEGAPESNEVCDTDEPGECGFGQSRCEGGILHCDGVSPSAEVCDGFDNDCDGVIDNGRPGHGEDCDTGESGACALGVGICEAGDFTCEQVTFAGQEVCDNVDNDCDGEADEDDGAGGDCGPVGAGTYDDPLVGPAPPANCQDYRPEGGDQDGFYRMSNGVRFCELSVPAPDCLSPRFGEACVVRSPQTQQWSFHCPHWQVCPPGSHITMNADLQQSECARYQTMESGIGAYTHDVFYFDENTGRACSSGPNNWGNCNDNGCNSNSYGGAVDEARFRGGDRRGGVRQVRFQDGSCSRGNVCIQDW